MSERRIVPLLKWAGGKRWLAAKGVLSPTTYTRLVEPFAGSAAIFFSLVPKSALLSDVNEELINLYTVVKEYPKLLASMMHVHQSEHGKEYYYHIRSQVYDDAVAQAARMLYLNRTCWNGLYRVNKKGNFNVPIGTKNAVVLPGECFEEYSRILQSAELKCQDFEVTIDGCGRGDFLFVDPPYTVKHNMNGFVKYNENIFRWDDQVRLANALVGAAQRGASILVTNADHESVIDLYVPFFEYDRYTRHSVLAGSSAARGKTTEAIFTFNI